MKSFGSTTLLRYINMPQLWFSYERLPAEDGGAARLGDQRRVRAGGGAAEHAAPARPLPTTPLPHHQ
jgi:hypothetical protein